MTDREPLSDGELMRRTADGDRDAFAMLVDQFKDRLVTYLTRLCGDRERAEDLAQDSFVRLYQAAPGYRERGQLAGYLFRIATNLLRSEERRRRTFGLLRPLLAVAQPQRSEARASEQAVLSEAASRLRSELVELPLRFRAPLLLFEVEGWSYAEIAELMGCQAGTVKSRIHRGKARLRTALAPYWGPSLEGGELVAERGGEA